MMKRIAIHANGFETFVEQRAISDIKYQKKNTNQQVKELGILHNQYLHDPS